MSEPVIKVVVIGVSGVGKSQLIARVSGGAVSFDLPGDSGVSTRMISIRSVNYKLQVWDTWSPDKFRTINQATFRRVQGVLAVFAWSHSESLEHLGYWFDSLFEIHPEGSIPVVLVGNKEDREHFVTDEQAKKMADRYGAELLSTSAQTGNGVEEVFKRLVELVIERQESVTHPQEQSRVSLLPEQNKGSCR
jgi:small GTP-binding protein